MQEQSESHGISFDDDVKQLATTRRPFMALGRRRTRRGPAVIAFLRTARSSFVPGREPGYGAGSIGAI
jgi:hypothetical protein